PYRRQRRGIHHGRTDTKRREPEANSQKNLEIATLTNRAAWYQRCPLSIAGAAAARAMVDTGVFLSFLDQDRVRIALGGDEAGLITHCIERSANRLERPLHCDYIGRPFVVYTRLIDGCLHIHLLIADLHAH